MPENYQDKSRFEDAREVTPERRNRELPNLQQRVQEKKLEDPFERFKVWKETSSKIEPSLVHVALALEYEDDNMMSIF
jgi:hypothetical protein